MGLLKKLLPKASAEPTEPVRAAPVARAPRVKLLHLHNIWFERTEPPAPAGSRILLANISTTGAGFLRAEGLAWPAKGGTVRGVLHCGDRSLEVVLTVAHVTNRVAGCAFESGRVDIRELVTRYFDLELAALTMIQGPPEMLHAEPDGDPHWLHGKNGCEIHFVTDGKRIVRFSLSFFNNYIEGGEGRPTRFGVVSHEEKEDTKYASSSLVRWQRKPADEMVNTAIKFLQNSAHLSDAHRGAMMRMILTRK